MQKGCYNLQYFASKYRVTVMSLDQHKWMPYYCMGSVVFSVLLELVGIIIEDSRFEIAFKVIITFNY